MGELGDLLELLHTGATRYRTLRAVSREWTHHERMQVAITRYHERQAAGGTYSSSFYGASNEPPPETSETTRRLWIERPRRRLEYGRGTTNGHAVVDDGEVARHLLPGHGVVESPSQPGEPVPLTGDASALVGGFDFTLGGETEHAGRRGLRVGAVERQSLFHMWCGLWNGADRHELLVDAEFGVVLRAESFVDGEPFHLDEVIEIAFDEPIAPELFTLAPTDELPLIDTSTWPVPEHVNIDEAVAMVPFALFVPASLPEPWQLDGCVVTGGGAHPHAVMLHYSLGFSGHLSLVQQRHDESDEPSDDEPAQSELPAATGEQPGRIRMRVVRADTRIDLDGTLDRDEFAAIVASLVPAPGERPALEDWRPPA